jgi:hypothetical protein
VYHKTKVAQSPAVIGTADVVSAQDASAHPIEATAGWMNEAAATGLLIAQKLIVALIVTVADERSVVVIERAVVETANEKASRDPAVNLVKAVDANAAPVTRDALLEGMRGTGGVGAVVARVEEMMDARGSVIHRIRRTGT